MAVEGQTERQAGLDWAGLADLVDEPPGDADALLDVSDDAVARLEARVVVEGRPDLSAHLLQSWRRRGLKLGRENNNDSSMLFENT